MKYLKKILIILIFSLFAFSVQASGFLQGNTLNSINDNATAVQNAAGYDPNTTVGGVVAAVIKGFIALLGVIFVLLIVIAGYNWMTAAGDEEKITKAKHTLQRAIIGLIIIIAAYAITYFVFANLPGASNSYGGN